MPARVYTASTILIILAFACLLVLGGCGGDEPEPPTGSPGPDHVLSVNGNFFKAVMGDSIVDRSLLFAVADIANNNLPGEWLHFNLLTGDGTLSADSVISDSNGIAHLTYAFDNALGHAEIEYIAKGVDTGDVQLRANTLIPGVGGQGQYVLFSDTYRDVKRYNGLPVSVDLDPTNPITYANYEVSLNVVFVVNDLNQDRKAQDTEDILVIILTAGYTGKTKDSIGIGTTYNRLRELFGMPDTVYRDPAPPPALTVRFDSLGMIFFMDTVASVTVDTNTTVFEIHMDDFIAPVSKAVRHSARLNPVPKVYRRYHFKEQ